jgi:hypothetical protein
MLFFFVKPVTLTFLNCPQPTRLLAISLLRAEFVSFDQTGYVTHIFRSRSCQTGYVTNNIFVKSKP